MLGNDLSVSFRLFGIPVRVGAFFVLIAVLLGQRIARQSPALLLVWVVIVFVGVLLHELGHALAARSFGQVPAISLHGLGGVTSWRPRGDFGAGKRLVVSLAGPATGIVVGLLVLVIGAVLTAKGTTGRQVALWIVYVNLWWGLLNLIPMLPLDGGNIMGSLFEMAAPGKGMRAARYVSLVLAAGLGALALAFGEIFAVLLCGLFAYVNFQELRGSPPTMVAPPPPTRAALPEVERHPPDRTA